MLVATVLPIFLACCSLVHCAPVVQPTDPEAERQMVINSLFPPVQADLARYPEIRMPAYFWLYVASNLDASSIWNLSLTCKSLGAAFRQENIFPALFQNVSYPELLDMLANSDRTIGEWAKPLLTAENVLQMKMVKADRSLYDLMPGARYLSKAGTEKIVGMFLPRAQNLHVEKMVYFDVGNRRHIELDSIPEALEDSLFYIKTEASSYKEMHYLPENKNQKLFDLIDPSTLARLTWSFKGSWTLFHDSIIADYVLPAWRNEYVLSVHEINCIQALVKWGPMYTSYFNNLIWALYYIDEAMDSDYMVIGEIAYFFESLGFNFFSMESAWRRHNLRVEASQRTECMLYIYATAVQWGLDIEMLAKITPTNPISQHFLREGTLPAYVLNQAEINERNIFNIAFEGETSSLTKAKFEEGKFSAVDGSVDLKRKREDDDGVELESSKRPKFLTKGTPPIIQNRTTFLTASMSTFEFQDILRMITTPPKGQGYSEEESSEESEEDESMEDSDENSSEEESSDDSQ